MRYGSIFCKDKQLILYVSIYYYHIRLKRYGSIHYKENVNLLRFNILLRYTINSVVFEHY